MTGASGLLEQIRAVSIQADVESPAVIKVVEQQIREMKRPAEERPRADRQRTDHRSIREKYLRYRVEVEILPGSGILRVADEYAAALNSKGEPTGNENPSWNGWGSAFTCEWKGRLIPCTTSVTWTIASSHGPSIHRTTPTWSQCGMS